MNYHLPYYMAYPMPLQYDDERIERRDFEYMKHMYPMAVKQILPYVEDECERMSYEGSMIYDEYPDQLQIRLMCNRVYDQVKNLNSKNPLGIEMPESRKDDWLKELIQVMIFQELFRRRTSHRRNKRRFY